MTEQDLIIPPPCIVRLKSGFAKLRFIVVGVALVLVGLALEPSVECCFGQSSPLKTYAMHLGEALMIAGVLAVAVDPILKRELAEHASSVSHRDLIQRAFGYPLPDRIIARIHELTSLDRISKNQRMTYRFSRPDETTGKVRAWVDHEYELQNLTYRAINFRPRRVFPNFEGVKFTSFRWIDAGGTEHSVGDGSKDLLAQSAEQGHEGELIFELSENIQLPPRQAGQADAPAVKFFATWTVDGPLSWGESHASWTTPAIGILVVVKDAEQAGLTVVVHGPPADQQTSSSWEFHRAVMPFEVLAVRWFPTPPDEHAG